MIELTGGVVSSDDVVRPKELGTVSKFKEREYLVESIMNEMPDADRDTVRELLLTFDGDVKQIFEIIGPLTDSRMSEQQVLLRKTQNSKSKKGDSDLPSYDEVLGEGAIIKKKVAPAFPQASSAKLKYQVATQLPLQEPMRGMGPSNEILRFCPMRAPLSFASYQYHHHSIPDFPICTLCYSKYISSSPFSNEFVITDRPVEDGICLFNCPRMTKLLWPAAVNSGEFKSIVSYMAQRSEIRNCKRTEAAYSHEGHKWYTSEDAAFEGLEFAICGACYEEFVVDSSLESASTPLKQRINQRLKYSGVVPYVYKLFDRSMDRPNSADPVQFATGVAERISLQHCNGVPIRPG